MSVAEEYDQDGELITVSDNSTALEAINRSEIDIQIMTAKRFPRSIKLFKAQALEMATLDEDTAASMFYALPRGGKKIEGPSVRLAEVVGSSWGNLRYGARVVAMDDKFVTAQGMCFDLEKNISAAVEVKRRITGKDGKTFKDDMIQVTSNAACSIALRQAIFKIVPFAFVKGIYEEAKLCSIGKATSMSEKRHKAFDWFKKAGATETQILAFLGRKGVEDVTIEDLITLRGLVTAIRDGETTIEEALATNEPEAGSKAKKSDMKPEDYAPTASADQSETGPDWAAIKRAFAKADTEDAVGSLYEECLSYSPTPDQGKQIEAWRVEAMARVCGVKSKKQQEMK